MIRSILVGLLFLAALGCTDSTHAKGLDLNAYCQAHGHAGAVNVDNTGYGWRCDPGNASIDMNDVCHTQDGQGTHAVLTSPPPGGAKDWVCKSLSVAGDRRLNLESYCKARGYTGVINLDNTGYGWRCSPGNVSIETGDVCRSEYGVAYQAVLKTSPPGDTDDWVCRTNPDIANSWAGFASFQVDVPGVATVNGGTSGAGPQLHVALPPLPDQTQLQACLSSSNSREDFAACVAQRALPQQYRISAQCAQANREDGGRALACSTGNPEILNAYDRIKRIKGCTDESGGGEYAGAPCIGDETLSSDDRYYLSCITKNHGDFRASAMCSLAKDLTPEQQIALSCGVSSGGEPHAFAACTGGQLLSRELDKCWDHGIGTDDGCFGPNNDIRKFLESADDVIRNAAGEHSVVYQAYSTLTKDVLDSDASRDVVKILNDGLGDLKDGPGPSNTVVQVTQALSDAGGGVLQSIADGLGF